MAQPFILASGSPRRRQLLQEAGYEFQVIVPSGEEVAHSWLTIRELTTWNATRKASKIARRFPDAVILGADTLVTIEGEIIGKPVDLDDAAKILRRLSGRTHQVCTAVRICDLAAGRSRSFHEISRVHFRKLSEGAIGNYLAKIDPLDKAGAYAAQGHGAEIIEWIEGSSSNVVGLPMKTTARMLRDFGIHPAAKLQTLATRHEHLSG